MKDYKSYPNSELVNPSNWEKLIKMPRQQVQDIYDSWCQIEKDNKLIYEENAKERRALFKELTDTLDKYGIKYKLNKSIFSKSKKKYEPFFEKIVEHISSIKHYIPYSFPYVQTSYGDGTVIDGIKIYNNGTRNIVEFYDYALKTFEMFKKQEKENENHFIECVKQAQLKNINIENLSKEEIIDKVETELKADFLREKYPNGTNIEIDDNFCECQSYTIGDRRCDCGNRRISFWVDGDCLNGYSLTTEPY